MLYARAKSWFSWSFTVYDGNAPVAHVEKKPFKKGVVCRTESKEYMMHRRSWKGREYLLSSGEEVLCRAVATGFFRITFDIHLSDKRLFLRADSGWNHNYTLCDDFGEVGYIRSGSVFTRDATLDLPDTLPLEVKTFIFWLTWQRRQKQSSQA